MTHIGKADAQALVVNADERIVAQKVDMVFDEHDVPLGPLRIHAAARIADDEHLATERFHDAHGKGNLLEGVAFVKMEPPLHGHDLLAAEGAAHQPARVRRHGRVREMRYVLVGEGHVRLDVFGQCPQPGAKDDRQTRAGPWPAHALDHAPSLPGSGHRARSPIAHLVENIQSRLNVY